MSHELDMSTGKAAVAARGGAKSMWHGHGQEILAGDSIEAIAKKAGLDWHVEQAPATFTDAKGNVHTIPDRIINYRSDNQFALGFVGPTWKVVQPRQVVEFFRDFFKTNKLIPETAGALRMGRIVWMMAKLGPDYSFLMPGKDKIDSYVRLQTGFGGGGLGEPVSTDLVATTTRQVCANTMRMVDLDALRNGFRVPHTMTLDPKALQRAFGLLGEQHKVTSEFWNALCARKVNQLERDTYFCELMGVEVADLTAVDRKTKQPVLSTRLKNMIGELTSCFEKGPGMELKSAKGTAFGLLQAVTDWVDHKSTVRDVHGEGEGAARANASWFGLGHRTKAAAQSLAAELAGCTELIGEKPREKVAA